ncbi:MAG: hypothetical protein AAB227_11000 [Pseudomonadota bacterium]
MTGLIKSLIANDNSYAKFRWREEALQPLVRAKKLFTGEIIAAGAQPPAGAP